MFADAAKQQPVKQNDSRAKLSSESILSILGVTVGVGGIGVALAPTTPLFGIGAALVGLAVSGFANTRSGKSH